VGLSELSKLVIDGMWGMVKKSGGKTLGLEPPHFLYNSRIYILSAMNKWPPSLRHGMVLL
jgi:hypothetical protein